MAFASKARPFGSVKFARRSDLVIANDRLSFRARAAPAAEYLKKKRKRLRLRWAQPDKVS